METPWKVAEIMKREDAGKLIGMYHHWITKRDQQQAVNNALSKYKKREIL